jgi:hypothetical protein
MRHDYDQRCHVIDIHRGSDYYHHPGLDDCDRGCNVDDDAFPRYEHSHS